jgi:hypothetical protein
LLQSFAAKQAQKSPYSAVTIGAFLYGGERGIDKYQAEACYLVLRTAFGAQNATHFVEPRGVSPSCRRQKKSPASAMRGMFFGGERGILFYQLILLTCTPIRLYLLQTFATKEPKYG